MRKERRSADAERTRPCPSTHTRRLSCGRRGDIGESMVGSQGNMRFSAISRDAVQHRYGITRELQRAEIEGRCQQSFPHAKKSGVP